MINTTNKRKIFFTNPTTVPNEQLEKIGAKETKVQYLIGERQGSNRFSMRIYTVEKGGQTPLDEHPHEHQVYILRGHGLIRESKDESKPFKSVNQGDAIFIPSNAIHQFINKQEEPLVFLCIKGDESLYEVQNQSVERPRKEPDRAHC